MTILFVSQVSWASDLRFKRHIQKCTYYDVPTLELNGMVNNCEQLFLLTVGSVNIFAYSLQKKLPLGVPQ